MPSHISDKKVIFTLTMHAPKKKGLRSITVAGAPDGEMPVIKQGTFADRHALVDQIWSELQTRAPQVPQHTAPKPEPKPTAQPAKDEQPAVGDAPEGDQLVAAATEPPANLPTINEPASNPEPVEAPASEPTIHSPLEAAILATKSEA